MSYGSGGRRWNELLVLNFGSEYHLRRIVAPKIAAIAPKTVVGCFSTTGVECFSTTGVEYFTTTTLFAVLLPPYFINGGGY